MTTTRVSISLNGEVLVYRIQVGRLGPMQSSGRGDTKPRKKNTFLLYYYTLLSIDLCSSSQFDGHVFRRIKEIYIYLWIHATN